jgi:hypothetical protein
VDPEGTGSTGPGRLAGWLAGFMLDRREASRTIGTGVTAPHIGTLGLVAEPMATELERLAASPGPGSYS